MIADRLAQIEDPTLRAAGHGGVGKSGTKLLPMIADGVQELKTAAAGQRPWTNHRDRGCKAAEVFGDRLDDLKVLKSTAFTTGALLPC